VNVGHKSIEENNLSASLDARFRGPLMGFFLRRIGRRADAEELTQQVFVRILGGDERKIKDPEAFVFKVAANLLRDRVRQGARRGGDHAALDEALIGKLTQEFLEDRSPERVVLGQESLAGVLAALDELGQRTRDIFILFRLDKMKQREIASIYRISPSTVEKQVMRATMHLTLRFGSA
jgi:RNA polymerase sigma-70 factor (ECF subfamily)